ncbi:MAG: FixH family protein [Bacteroidota bacterium]
MKFNWGFGIALFYLSFMVTLVYVVFKSTTYDHSLVMDNYYEQDLQYQQHYEKLQNAQALAQQVSVQYDDQAKTIAFQFPEHDQLVKGTIHFFCPSTKHGDWVEVIKLDEQQKMTIAKPQLMAGRWKIKIDWTDTNKKYFQETEMML